MTELEINSYIQEHLFHTEKWEGEDNVFKGRKVVYKSIGSEPISFVFNEIRLGYPTRPQVEMVRCNPGDWCTDISYAYSMEEEIKRQGLYEKYIACLSKIIDPEVGIFDSAIEINVYNLNQDGSKYLFEMIHATPMQRALACVKMLKGE